MTAVGVGYHESQARASNGLPVSPPPLTTSMSLSCAPLVQTAVSGHHASKAPGLRSFAGVAGPIRDRRACVAVDKAHAMGDMGETTLSEQPDFLESLTLALTWRNLVVTLIRHTILP